MKPFGNWFALTKYHVIANISSVRWRFVLPVYLVILLSFIANARRDTLIGIPLGSDANVWDVGLSFLCDVFNDGLLILLGFMLLVGDDIARGHKDGTLRSTLLLSRSMQKWWITRVLAMGVLAFAYIGLVQVAIMVASLVMGVRIELGNSGASVRIADIPISIRWYALPEGWSTLGYNAFALFSLAFTSWVVVVVHQAASLLVFPNRRIPFIVFFTWLMLGFVIQPSGAWWDLRFLLYPGKCFDNFGGGATSIPVFFGVMSVVLVSVTALGYRRLRRMDL